MLCEDCTNSHCVGHEAEEDSRQATGVEGSPHESSPNEAASGDLDIRWAAEGVGSGTAAAAGGGADGPPN